MDDILTTLKVGLSTQLQKQGSSLEELEDAFANINQAQGATKVAELLGKTAFLGDALGSLAGFAGNMLKAVPEVGMTTALMGGSALGAGAYGIKKHLEGQDKEYADKEQEIQRIKSLTDRLTQDYGLKHPHNG